MCLACYYSFKLVNGFVKDEEIDLYKSTLRINHDHVQSIISEVSLGTNNHVAEIEDNLGKPDKMMTIMEQIVSNNPHIRSCGISFVADYYPQKGHWFCPYAVKADDGQIEKRNIGSTRNDYLKTEWFKEALKAEKGYWSAPFFDSTDSITPLVAWMVPIHDHTGKAVAILGADLSLKWFSSQLVKGTSFNGDSISVKINDSDVDVSDNDDDDDDDDDNDSNSSSWNDRKWRFVTFNFIIDGNGTFIVHPDGSRVINSNYFECAKETPDTIDDAIGRQMVAGMSGTYLNQKGSPSHFEFFGIEDLNSYIFFEPIEGTNWTIALAVPRFMLDGTGLAIGTTMLVLVALALLVTRIVGRKIIKRATMPLKELADSADEVAKGNFNTLLPRIKHNDEIRLLRDSFEKMQQSLTMYVEELKETTAEKASIESELKIAHDIQMSMLPKTFPPYPERDDIDIYGTLTPAKDVGGDLFDFYIRDEHLFFCIGDVSGKGVPASLVMAVTRSLFRNISAHVTEPNLIVTALNDAQAEANDTNMFVTLFVGVLDLSNGKLQYCNAGHNAPLIIPATIQRPVFLNVEPNLPIGVMPKWQFTLQETVLEPQTAIFLFTDGLNEAEDAAHAQFGQLRIIREIESLMARSGNQPEVVVSSMTDAVHAFVGDAEQSDDLTMLAIRYQHQHEH